MGKLPWARSSQIKKKNAFFLFYKSISELQQLSESVDAAMSSSLPSLPLLPHTLLSSVGFLYFVLQTFKKNN